MLAMHHQISGYKVHVKQQVNRELETQIPRVCVCVCDLPLSIVNQVYQ